jgi:hypothetical protein
MCSVSTIVVAGALRVMLNGCAVEERACEYMGFAYGTAAHVECVEALTRDKTSYPTWKRLDADARPKKMMMWTP